MWYCPNVLGETERHLSIFSLVRNNIDALKLDIARIGSISVWMSMIGILPGRYMLCSTISQYVHEQEHQQFPTTRGTSSSISVWDIRPRCL
jgi:hypothetical protein